MTNDHQSRNTTSVGLAAFLVIAALSAGIYGGYRYGVRQERAASPQLAAVRPASADQETFSNPAPMSGAQSPSQVSGGAPASASPTQYAPVQISPAQEQLIGVKTGKAEYRNLEKTIRTVGRVEVDETRIAHVHSKITGWVEQVFAATTLQHVNKGEPLFSIYSPELVATQEEFLLAVRGQQSLGSSTLPNVSAGASSLLDATRRRLSLWDIPSRVVDELERTGKTQRTLTIESPITGHIMERNVFPSTYVTPDKELYMIVDHSVVWMYADIYEPEMALVQIGQRARATAEAYPSEVFQGRVSFAGPHLQEETRTLKVRLEFPNSELKLKPGMFTNVEVKIPLGRRLVVPESAVIDTGMRQVVFVVEGQGMYQPHDVRIGARTDGVVEVVSGLKAGEGVVTSANFLIDSESQLRAALAGMTMGAGVTGIGQAAPSSSQPAPKLQIELRTDPSPPKSGKNTLTATVADSGGKPIPDAEVKVVFFMPAMPGMGMAAMRSEAALAAAGGGAYRGEINVLGPGTWKVTVTVTQVGAPVGSRELTLSAQ